MSCNSIKALGAMFGAAFGDSLGAAVEFLSRNQILEKFGSSGIEFPAPCYGLPAGVITDDTQQVFGVSEGLINAIGYNLTEEAIRREIWLALKAWKKTQNDIRQNRSPGLTSLSSLCRSEPGTITARINQSNSCGGTMRAYPVGILFAGNPEKAFRIGMVSAATTHGGNEAILSSGAVALIVSELCDNKNFDEAIASTLIALKAFPNSRTSALLQKSLMLSRQNPEKHLPKLGLGWEGDETLAIATYATLCHSNDFLAGVRLAANHDGDSDSTASITGAFLGTILGLDAIPREWREKIERRGELVSSAIALANIETNIR